MWVISKTILLLFVFIFTCSQNIITNMISRGTYKNNLFINKTKYYRITLNRINRERHFLNFFFSNNNMFQMIYRHFLCLCENNKMAIFTHTYQSTFLINHIQCFFLGGGAHVIFWNIMWNEIWKNYVSYETIDSEKKKKEKENYTYKYNTILFTKH